MPSKPGAGWTLPCLNVCTPSSPLACQATTENPRWCGCDKGRWACCVPGLQAHRTLRTLEELGRGSQAGSGRDEAGPVHFSHGESQQEALA